MYLTLNSRHPRPRQRNQNPSTNVSYRARTVSGSEFSTFTEATHNASAVGTSVNVSDLTALTAWP